MTRISTIIVFLFGFLCIITGEFGYIDGNFDQYLAYVLQFCGLLIVLFSGYLEFYRD
jgi:hypothetical protein